MTKRPRWLRVLIALACTLGPSLSHGNPNALQPASASPSTDAPGKIGQLLARSHALEGSNIQESLRQAQEALREARVQALPALELAGLLQVGKSQRLISDYPAALRTAQEGMLLAETLKDESTRGELLVLRGTVEWNQAKIPEATVSMMEALRLGDVLGNKHVQFGAMYGQGLVRARCDDLEGSQQYLEEALQLAEETGDERLDAALNALGNLHLQRKDYTRAGEFFQRAQSVVQANGNRRLMAYILLNLGQLYEESGDQATAGKSLDEAMAICREFQLQRGMADIYYLMAGRHRRLGQYDEALKDLADAHAIARKINNPDLFVSIFQEYIQTEEARGNYQGALTYMRQLAAQLEAVRGDKAQQQAREIQARYEAESRARQIKLLQLDQELQRSAAALASAQLSQLRSRYTMLSVLLVVGSLGAAVVVKHQRTRVRRTVQTLAATRAEKRAVEVADARKAELLSLAARHLSESETRFRCAFEHSALGIAIVAEDGRWLRVNPALCEIVGYTPEELLATDFQAITHPDDLESDMDLLRQMIADEIQAYHMEKRYLRKDGREVWVRLDVTLVRDPATESPLYFVSQVQDIGERRRAQEQLLAAKEEAERANEAKTEFLSRMSHELRTPLNAILGFGQLLELDDLGERQNQSVTHILVAGRHLLELINEVLDITQMESGNLHVTAEPTPIRATVESMVHRLQPLCEQAEVEIGSQWQEIDPALCVQADPRRLRQVLLNLLSNAIKYNRPGGEIQVTCREEGTIVCLDIQDTGSGISDEDLTRIFEPFTRLPQTAKVPGTGLGLSLSKGLTEAMGGCLRVRSRPNQGSTFSLEFARVLEVGPECKAEPLLLELIAID